MVESDRASGGNGGLFAYGQIQKTPVEDGAELSAYYMGGNVQHYFYQPFNPLLEFTTEMSVMVWVKDWVSGTSLFHRGPDSTRNSSTSFYLYCDATHDIRFTLTSNGSTEQNFEIQLPNTGVGVIKGWQHVCFTLKGGTVKGYLNGVQQVLPNTSFTGTNIYAQDGGGGNGSLTAEGSAGTTNTGGGGGGGNSTPYINGKSGASGTVILAENFICGVQAPGMWTLNEVYDNVKADNWTN